MLVGDVYAEYHRLNDHQEQVIQKQKSHAEVRMSNEVAMEVKCLKRKLGKDKQNCGTCSLINCSCQSDRVVAAVLAAVVLRPLQSMVERKIKKNTQTETFIHNLEIMRSSMHTKLRKGLK
jgi:alpha-D-ribose 1-methylphosphonate 5-triphosphate synthase subunit PhnG